MGIDKNTSNNHEESILIIVPRLAGGGQERMAALTADILLEKYNVSIVIFSNEKMAYKSNAEIINLNIPTQSGFFKKILQQIKRIWLVRKIKRDKNPSAVYSIGNTANITNVFSGAMGRRIISIRGYANIRKNFIDELIYRRADTITCISREMREKLCQLYPYAKNKTKVLYNGIDIKKVRELSTQISVIDELPKTKKIVTAGRLTDVKGYRQLLKSFSLLKEMDRDVSLIILGDGENKNALENLAKQLSIGDSVIFLGFQNNPYAFLHQCDLFVLSSIHEGFGNVIVEAMACDLPIISTSCLSGPAEILGSDNYNIDEITYAEYGILVPSFSNDYAEEKDKEQMMAKAMYKLISDQAINEHYIEKSRQRVGTYSVEKYSENIIQLLRYLY
jgi:glycosyltransferase involved in cell wall biosynthesis